MTFAKRGWTPPWDRDPKCDVCGRTRSEHGGASQRCPALVLRRVRIDDDVPVTFTNEPPAHIDYELPIRDIVVSPGVRMPDPYTPVVRPEPVPPPEPHRWEMPHVPVQEASDKLAETLNAASHALSGQSESHSGGGGGSGGFTSDTGSSAASSESSSSVSSE